MSTLAENIQVNEPVRTNPKPARIVFAGGGTGGHLYPSLAVAAALRDVLPKARFSFYATNRKVDQDILSAAGETLLPQAVAPLTMKPWRWPGFWTAWRKSMKACSVDFKGDRPDLVVGSGAFASAPAICTAAKMGIPTALLNPDVIPGRANRMLAKRVDCVLAQFESTRQHLPDDVRVEVVGCPVRKGFGLIESDRQSIYSRHGLDEQRRTLLVTGASLAARSINDAMCRLASDLGAHGNWQVVHLTGRDDLDKVQSAYASHRVHALCLAYTEAMSDFMSIADLVVSRAGASTLAELRAVGVPAIFVPYPHHRDQHQLVNAMELVNVGAGRVCEESDDPLKTAAKLRGLLLELISNDRALATFKAAAEEHKFTDAAQRTCHALLELAGLCEF
ncbi:MAG TPA: UDP-N-acetylglucosamine--N-acetylmuramyl-(pentapeptide) pyrophosphoryl-undecaprenol N-acetylglucosamine transferase [Phycisphaerae bacterium]|nr:UDP-N-acetylglucosamine--N-acetylmuramyl-(pentapeptide) pyrophosphoryl-undecaprenol N-acetylglucosamine transferase [Phycisphaerae bacterium]